MVQRLYLVFRITQLKGTSMSITKTTTVDQITVTENGSAFYREATRIMEDGVSISQTYHRSSISPGASLDNVPPQVALIAQATWTPENIAPVTQAVTEAIAVQQAAITEAAAKKAALEAAAAKEIEDAKVRETAANEAKAAAEAAEQAAKAAEASAKAAADAAEKENARLAQALAVAEAAAKAAADKQAFDDAVAAAVREAA